MPLFNLFPCSLVATAGCPRRAHAAHNTLHPACSCEIWRWTCPILNSMNSRRVHFKLEWNRKLYCTGLDATRRGTVTRSCDCSLQVTLSPEICSPARSATDNKYCRSLNNYQILNTLTLCFASPRYHRLWITRYLSGIISRALSSSKCCVSGTTSFAF